MIPMKHANSRQIIQKLLTHVDVQIDGNRPWDLQVDNPDFFIRVLRGGSLALGESYMDGWWNCEALDQLFDKIMSARLDKQVKKRKGKFIGHSKSKDLQCPKQVKSVYHRKAAL